MSLGSEVRSLAWFNLTSDLIASAGVDEVHALVDTVAAINAGGVPGA